MFVSKADGDGTFDSISAVWICPLALKDARVEVASTGGGPEPFGQLLASSAADEQRGLSSGQGT